MGRYVCLNCGESTSFRQIINYTEYGKEDQYMDERGEINESGDMYDQETEYGDVDTILCNDCDSSDVKWFDNDQEAQIEIDRISKEQIEQHPKKFSFKNKIITH